MSHGPLYNCLPVLTASLLAVPGQMTDRNYRALPSPPKWTYHRICHEQLVTQTHSREMLEGSKQAVSASRRRPLAAILEADNRCRAKPLPSCPTLCDPADGSPPGSSVPGMLQARTLAWVAISFSCRLPHLYLLKTFNL